MLGKIADLHIHSFYSDGTMSPKEILTTAFNKGVGLLAITDHDILAGSVELMKLYDKYDIKHISGVEIDVIDSGINYHILGYGVNLEDKVFCDFIECYYPSHTEDITNACLEICEGRNLLITCGSHCHGEFQYTEIGEMNIPIENLKLEDIFSW